MSAIVVLPDHLHCLWRLPENEHDYSTRWNQIKRYYSIGFESEKRSKKRDKTLWQRRFWEHRIRDDDDWQRHLDYIPYNPVKHGYVERAVDWPYSSFRKWVDKGVYQPDWGVSSCVFDDFGFGE